MWLPVFGFSCMITYGWYQCIAYYKQINIISIIVCNSNVIINDSQSTIPSWSCHKLGTHTDLETLLHDHCSLVFLLFVAKILLSGWYSNDNNSTKLPFCLPVALICDLGSCNSHNTISTAISTLCVLYIVGSLYQVTHDWLVQLFHQMFPFGQGLVHTYWARNVWAFYMIVNNIILDNDHQFNPMVCHLTGCNYQIVTVIIFVISLHSCHCIFCSMCTKKPFWMCWFHLLYWLFSWVVMVYFGNCWITKKKNQEDDLHVVSSFQKKEEEDRPASSTASSSKGLQ